MAVPATASSFDVAYWFLERALNEGEYLQPQKLHRLMYLAQAYFAVAYHRRLLMPAVFVADELGPVEPGVFRACAVQKPPLEPQPLSEIAIQFLDSIWRRFGQHSSDYLNRMIAGHPPYREARAQGVGTEIAIGAMVSYYGRRAPKSAAAATPDVAEVLRPKVMRSATGKPVSVQRWVPRSREPQG